MRLLPFILILLAGCTPEGECARDSRSDRYNCRITYATVRHGSAVEQCGNEYDTFKRGTCLLKADKDYDAEVEFAKREKDGYLP